MTEERRVQLYEKEFKGDTPHYKIVEAGIGVFEAYGIKTTKIPESGQWVTNSSALVRINGQIKNVPLALISFI